MASYITALVGMSMATVASHNNFFLFKPALDGGSWNWENGKKWWGEEQRRGVVMGKLCGTERLPLMTVFLGNIFMTIPL